MGEVLGGLLHPLDHLLGCGTVRLGRRGAGPGEDEAKGESGRRGPRVNHPFLLPKKGGRFGKSYRPVQLPAPMPIVRRSEAIGKLPRCPRLHLL
jgi:hypothetical protein